MAGRRFSQAGLKSMGPQGSTKLQYVLDLTDVINSMNFMKSAEEVLKETSKLGETTKKYIVEYAYNSYSEDLMAFARANSSNIAHVYQWESVIDISRTTGYQKKLKSAPPGGLSIKDTENTFIPTVNPNVPLFYLSPPKKQGNSFYSLVVFAKNNKMAMYDSSVYSASRISGPKRWGTHKFTDQAKKLENTQKIMKRSDRISKRRVGFSRKTDSPNGNIVQLSAGGALQNYQNYTRENKFYRRFAEFYMAFATKAIKSVESDIESLDKDINLAVKGQADKILQQQSKFVKGGLSGVSMTISGSTVLASPRGRAVNMLFTNKGKLIASIPPAKPVYANPLAEAIWGAIYKNNEKIDESFLRGPRRVRKAARVKDSLGLNKGGMVRVKVKGKDKQMTTVASARAGEWSWSKR